MRTDDQYTWNDEDHIYPLTVVKDRYQGSYSKGVYTAWNLNYYEIPAGPDSSDIPCMDFWDEYRGIVGKGATIEEAVADLRNKLFHKYDDTK